jgi:hypothetical protein
VGPTASLGVFEMRKIFCPFQNSKPSHKVIRYSEVIEENL